MPKLSATRSAAARETQAIWPFPRRRGSKSQRTEVSMRPRSSVIFVLTAILLVPTGANLAQTKTHLLLCLPERFWTCNGIGECQVDPRSETLAAWKIDLTGGRYALCNRNGTECGEWRKISVDKDAPEFFYVLHDPGNWQPETFKIDRPGGKFVAVRLSGGFIDTDAKPLGGRRDLARVLVRQRSGSCVELDR